MSRRDNDQDWHYWFWFIIIVLLLFSCAKPVQQSRSAEECIEQQMNRFHTIAPETYREVVRFCEQLHGKGCK
jgi:hypothetical protein